MENIGSIVFWSETSRYGFVRSDWPGGRDVFVHADALVDRSCTVLARGTRVRYEVVDHPRGPRAARVTVLGDGTV